MCSVKPTRLGFSQFLFCFLFFKVNWLPTVKNQEIPYKLEDLAVLGSHSPSAKKGYRGAVLTLLMQLCTGLKVLCTCRLTLQQNWHGHLSLALQAHNSFQLSICSSVERLAILDLLREGRRGSEWAMGRGRVGQLSSSTTQERTRSNGFQSEADSESG